MYRYTNVHTYCAGDSDEGIGEAEINAVLILYLQAAQRHLANVSMCVCMDVYVCIHMQSIHIRMHVCVWMFMCVCIDFISASSAETSCKCEYVRVCMHPYARVCMDVYVCMYWFYTYKQRRDILQTWVCVYVWMWKYASICACVMCVCIDSIPASSLWPCPSQSYTHMLTYMCTYIHTSRL